MRRWGYRYGRWWMVQFSWDWTISLGLHIDPLRRVSERGPYGPYVDLHFLIGAVSFGYHPARASALVELYGQGAIMRPEH